MLQLNVKIDRSLLSMSFALYIVCFFFLFGLFTLLYFVNTFFKSLESEETMLILTSTPEFLPYVFDYFILFPDLTYIDIPRNICTVAGLYIFDFIISFTFIVLIFFIVPESFFSFA